MGIIFVMVAAYAVPASAEEFFGDGIGLRAMAMGGAFVAVADDAAAGFWNPAGLAELIGVHLLGSLSLRGASSFEDLRFYAASVTLGATTLGAIFAQKSLLFSVVQDERALLLGSLAMRLGPNISGGANLKFYERIHAGQKARGVGLDMGFLLRPTGPLAVGVVFRDAIGTKLRYEKFSNQEIPPSMSLGIALKLGNLRLAGGFDLAEKALSQPRFGLEARPFGLFALRVGKNGDSWTAGFGLGIENLISIDVMLFGGGWLISTELILFGF